eukprot:m.233702 g.233702  ORF g.233702 m.233702 type:complete len:781 (-) comp19280_c0_seq1:100-2442(-)
MLENQSGKMAVKASLAVFILALSLAAADITVQFGQNVPAGVVDRMNELIKLAPHSSFEITLSCGNTSLRSQFISDSELANTKDEGFLVRHTSSPQSAVLAADGVGRGISYACYEALRQVGYAFLHPLSPVIPLQLSCVLCSNVSEAPYWPVRSWHVHTEHPLELTDFLQGFDVRVNASVLLEPWESMMPQWVSFLDWCVANKINQVEYVMLNGHDWRDYALSAERQGRLRLITTAAQRVGVRLGADAAIAITQQHDFALINTTKDDEVVPSIHYHLDWLLTGAGFDFISTESGFSEFNHPDDTKMLLWMNITTEYAASLGKKAYIKCHCSTGQYCTDYKDPRTGKPLNFNYLPIYADPRLAMMPHTVQFYAYDDPAPTYGNQNFTDMFDFMLDFMHTRETIFHPETAYWVNYDIDVPLFLPVYAYSRVRDLRYIMREEQRRGARIAGQNVFDSGWEWGYWLQDVVTSRAVWDPCVSCPDDDTAFSNILLHVLSVFGSAAPGLTKAVQSLAMTQRQLFVKGVLINGTAPTDVVRHNAQGYLEGWDTWADIGTLNPHFLATQPTKFSLLDVRRPKEARQYWASVSPLLHDTNTTLAAAAAQMAALAPSIPTVAQALYQELHECVQVLSLRASTVYGLYDYAASWEQTEGHTHAWRVQRLDTARSAIMSAVALVAAREAGYRVPVTRIAGWRWSPTSYSYGYLWTVHSLYYWYRDAAIAVLSPMETLSPCFRNIINPVDVAIGEGLALNASEALKQWIERTHPSDAFIADCLAAPTAEPHYHL